MPSRVHLLRRGEAAPPEPRRALTARFVAAMHVWGNGGLDAARKDLEAVAHADVIGAVESDIALEVLEPARGAIPGTPKVPGL